MGASAHFANTIAAEILARLYREHEQPPAELEDQTTALFPEVADQFGVPEGDRTSLRRLTWEAIEAFTSRTNWEEYHRDLSGPYAHLIDAPVMLTQRLAQLT